MRVKREKYTGTQSWRDRKADTYGSSRYADKNTGESGRTSANTTSGRNRTNSTGNSFQRRRSRRRRKARGSGYDSRRTLVICFAVFLVLVVAVVAGIFLISCSGTDGSIVDALFSGGRKDEADSETTEVTVDLDSLYSPYAVLIDRDSGTVIGSKRSDEIIYPASMTKILSVWVAIENIDQLDASVTMSYDFYGELYAEGASQAGFEPGETTTIRELLYGALLPSGAECCMQLAIEAAGSEDGLVELMNQKVEELGLTESHFTNCTGLHDDNQYTTVYEMALILQAALQNDTFRTVFTTHYHVMAATNVHPDGFTVWSTFFKNVADEIVTGGEILGAKTGYTQEAGLCLATLAQVGDKEYILVTAGWASEGISSYHISDAFSGYNLLGETLGYGAQSEEASGS